MYKNRPRLTPEMTLSDKILEVASIVLLLTLVVCTAFLLTTLPAEVPMHFNLQGDPDRYGSKEWLVFFPSVAILLYALLTAINRSPHSFNYIVNITEKNALPQYALAMRFMRVLKVLLMGMFILIEWSVARVAMGTASTTGWWMLPVILSMTLVPVIFYMIRSWRIG